MRELDHAQSIVESEKYRMTISDLEKIIAKKLGELSVVPVGFRVNVELHSNNRRKKRTASADNWHPTRGDIGIFRFEPLDTKEDISGASVIAPSPTVQDIAALPVSAPTAIQELVRCLANAEAIPGYQFIALKWFRDTYLASQPLAWAGNADIRRQVIAEAIEGGLIVTAKIPNPHQPFPTTTIRVNRNNPVARSILGLEPQKGWAFTPVEVRGEPVSETMLRERG